jgi:hypothetical protein
MLNAVVVMVDDSNGSVFLTTCTALYLGAPSQVCCREQCPEGRELACN